MKRPPKTKAKVMPKDRRGVSLKPATRRGPSNVLAQGGPNSSTGPDIRKFHGTQSILIRDFKAGLNLKEQLEDSGLMRRQAKRKSHKP